MSKKLGNVSLMPAIEGISRKLALRRETCTQKSVLKGTDYVVIPGRTYMGVITKDVNVIGYGAAKRVSLFMRKSTILGPVSADQMEVRTNFTAARKWVGDALKDLSALTANQQTFKEAVDDLNKTINGISASGYQSQRGYMMGVAMAILKDGGTLPVNHQLPQFDA